MSDLSRLVDDVIAFIRGKPVPTIDADAQKALADVKRVIDGAYGVVNDAPNITGLIADLGAMAISGTVLLASRGGEYPEFAALLAEVKDLAGRLDKVATDYQSASAVVAAAPKKTP